MPRKKYLSNLNDEERQRLFDLTRKGTLKACQFKRAMILLKANEGSSDLQIMATLNVSCSCMEHICKRFVTDGPERALNEDPRQVQKRKLDGHGEARLFATACSDAPAGYEHRTLRLSAGKLVELGVVGNILYETVRRTFKKTI
jgi:hypothetical protein